MTPRHGENAPTRGYPPRRRRGVAVAATLGLLLSLASGLFFAMDAQAATTPVPLGTAQTYSVLAGTQVSNTGNTTLVGDLGVSPGTAVTGFPPGIVYGTTRVAAAAAGAQDDLVIAYDNAAGRPASTLASAELKDSLSWTVSTQPRGQRSA